ncbi:dihydrofolate reductase family protein [Pantanalinema sp. GBBB05]|uniref:dihydrofolate reductase family protein n=1 Tax=Pantanalinema sp. GBBB05 TaxID=2604139 RepID=UPI001D3937E2|nr:dihydrofolate reductase [Pantanalinema sp. GBBB05]
MVEIVYYVAISLDGYIATLDGGIDWLPPLDSENEDFGYAEFYATIDGLIMGRHTYEKVLELGEWMYADKPCWICSHQSVVVERSEVILTDKQPKELVTELETQQLKRVWLVGGGQLASSFRREGLISEYIVTVIPVILGEGIPFLIPSPPQEQLRLIDCKPYTQGAVLLQYVRDRAI